MKNAARFAGIRVAMPTDMPVIIVDMLQLVGTEGSAQDERCHIHAYGVVGGRIPFFVGGTKNGQGWGDAWNWQCREPLRRDVRAAILKAVQAKWETGRSCRCEQYTDEAERLLVVERFREAYLEELTEAARIADFRKRAAWCWERGGFYDRAQRKWFRLKKVSGIKK